MRRVLCRAVENFELSFVINHRKAWQSRHPCAQGDLNQPNLKPGHTVAGRSTSAFEVGSRVSENTGSKLPMTRIDEVDIAVAATSGDRGPPRPRAAPARYGQSRPRWFCQTRRLTRIMTAAA